MTQGEHNAFILGWNAFKRSPVWPHRPGAGKKLTMTPAWGHGWHAAQRGLGTVDDALLREGWTPEPIGRTHTARLLGYS